MSMDVSSTIVPKSDQINAEDFLSGPGTFTVDRVSKGSTEQPVDVHLVETPGRAYRPSKSMRRVLIAAWGKDASQWAGRRLTLYRDPEVRFGGQAIGGIKISHLSHIEKRLELALTVTRGKRAPHVVDPIPAAAARSGPTAEEIDAETDVDALKGMWKLADVEGRARIEARVARLSEEDQA